VRWNGHADHSVSVAAQQFGASGHVFLRIDEGVDAAVIKSPPLTAFTQLVVGSIKDIVWNRLPAVVNVVGLERPVEIAETFGSDSKVLSTVCRSSWVAQFVLSQPNSSTM